MKAVHVVVLACLVLAGAPAVDAQGDPCVGGPVPHPPILIDGDEGFLVPANGVVAGDGSAADPFLICGWDIRPAGVAGIRIQDTRLHVVVRDNHVHDGVLVCRHVGGPSLLDEVAGIVLLNASHAVVQANEVEGFGHDCPAVIGGPTISPFTYGLRLVGAHHVRVTQNHVHGNSGYELVVLGGQEIRVDGNRLGTVFADGGVAGLDLDDNDLEDTFHNTGFDLRNAAQLRVTNNRIHMPVNYAVTLRAGTDGAHVEGNTFQATHGCHVCVEFALDVRVVANDLGGSAQHGVYAHQTTVDATENWWGCAQGPGAPGCTGTMGDVRFDPWRTEPIQ